jgi:hypothetical protein
MAHTIQRAPASRRRTIQTGGTTDGTLCVALSLPLPFLSLALVFSKRSNPAPPGVGARSVRVGVAMPLNESRFLVTGTWARDQVIRDLKTLQTDRKSPIIIEPVPLESQLKDDAVEECAAKHCVYVLLTKIVIVGFTKTGQPLVGSEAGARIPTLPVVDPRKQMGVDFTVMRPGHPNPIVEGRTAAPYDLPSSAAPSDNAAFEDAANQIALRVAKELRKQKSQVD